MTLVLGILLYGEPWNGNTIAGAGLMLVSVILVSRTAEVESLPVRDSGFVKNIDKHNQ